MKYALILAALLTACGQQSGDDGSKTASKKPVTEKAQQESAGLKGNYRIDYYVRQNDLNPYSPCTKYAASRNCNQAELVCRGIAEAELLGSYCDYKLVTLAK